MAFDRNNPTHLLELKTEVTTDPLALGYVPDSTQTGVLDIINLPRVGIEFQKGFASGALIRSSVTFDAFNALAVAEKEWLQWLTQGTSIAEEDVLVTSDLTLKLAGENAAGQNQSIWAQSDKATMEPVMRALLFRLGSRAEVLWGQDTFITSADWFAARDS